MATFLMSFRFLVSDWVHDLMFGRGPCSVRWRAADLRSQLRTGHVHIELVGLQARQPCETAGRGAGDLVGVAVLRGRRAAALESVRRGGELDAVDFAQVIPIDCWRVGIDEEDRGGREIGLADVDVELVAIIGCRADDWP
jgi:hypothetical protein